MIEDTLDANLDDDTQAQLHVLDSHTSWFGAGRDQQGYPVFRDFGRYANLMTEWPFRGNRETNRCYPALISFVGETGAGKSSLIKMLIGMYSGEGNAQVRVPYTFSRGTTSVLTPASEDTSGGQQQESRHPHFRGCSSF